MTMIGEKEYSRAFTEVLVILKFISDEDYNKIPKDIILALQDYKDDSYIYKLDFSKEFNKQNISELTKAILSNFYRDYWASDEQKSKLIEEENKERQHLEFEKRKKYNPDDIFKSHDLKQTINIRENNTNNSLIVKEKENTLQKILCKLKKILNFMKN